MHMLCRAFQFKKLYEMVCRELKEVVKHEQVKEPKEPAIHTKNIFKEKVKAFHYLRAPGIYTRCLRVKWRQHMSVAECILHLLCKRLLESDRFTCVNYTKEQNVVSAHPGFENGATHGPRLSVEEVLYGDNVPENSRKEMVTPEQQCMMLMKDIMQKYSGLVSWCWKQLRGHFLQGRRAYFRTSI